MSSRLGLKNVAIITLEQLAPFPFDRVKQAMMLHAQARPWYHMDPYGTYVG